VERLDVERVLEQQPSEQHRLQQVSGALHAVQRNAAA